MFWEGNMENFVLHLGFVEMLTDEFLRTNFALLLNKSRASDFLLLTRMYELKNNP